MNHPWLKGPPLFGAGLIALVALLVGLVWGRHVWKITHPVFKTHVVETSGYRASYPVDWAPIDPKDPRLGEKELTFLNHLGPAPEAEPWDRARMAMALRDEGPCASLDEFSAAMRKGEEAGPAATWTLANGLLARSWREAGPTVDIPSTMRWTALRGSNGRCYSAGWMESADWKTRLRYENAFRDILGSLEFK